MATLPAPVVPSNSPPSSLQSGINSTTTTGSSPLPHHVIDSHDPSSPLLSENIFRQPATAPPPPPLYDYSKPPPSTDIKPPAPSGPRCGWDDVLSDLASYPAPAAAAGATGAVYQARGTPLYQTPRSPRGPAAAKRMASPRSNVAAASHIDPATVAAAWVRISHCDLQPSHCTCSVSMWK